MIESARRPFLVCHNASKSDRGHHQRGPEREREGGGKEDREKLAIDRQERESQAGRETTRRSGRNKERETSRGGRREGARCEALAASIQQASAALNSVGPGAYV